MTGKIQRCALSKLSTMNATRASVHFNGIDQDDSELSVDFCHLDPSASLIRPSDHFTTNHYPGNAYLPPTRDSRRLAARFMRNPVITTLTTFGRVANVLLNPGEDNGSIFEIIQPKSDEPTNLSSRKNSKVNLPPPAIPEIICSNPEIRLKPLDGKYL